MTYNFPATATSGVAMCRRERRLVWWWQNTCFVSGGFAPMGRWCMHDALCSRGARPTRLGSPGGPDLYQALECPPMPVHARRGHPVKVGACTGQQRGRAARWDPRRQVRVPAPIVDQFVQLPGLIRQRPRVERLLDCGTLAGGLPLPCSIGRLLGSGGGIVRAYGHPVPAAPGRFARSTGRIEAWASHSRRTPSRLLCYDMGRYDALGVLCYARRHATAASMRARTRVNRGRHDAWGGPTTCPTGHRPSTCASVASAWGSQKVMSMSRYRSMARAGRHQLAPPAGLVVQQAQTMMAVRLEPSCGTIAGTCPGVCSGWM
jgi:hypothetical protein